MHISKALRQIILYKIDKSVSVGYSNDLGHIENSSYPASFGSRDFNYFLVSVLTLTQYAQIQFWCSLPLSLQSTLCHSLVTALPVEIHGLWMFWRVMHTSCRSLSTLVDRAPLGFLS